MAKILTCTLCNLPVTQRPTNFVKGNKFWTINVFICENETCMKSRGGISVLHRTEMGDKRGKSTEKSKV